VTSIADRLGTAGSHALGRPITTSEAARLDNYMKLLIKWQRVQRLVGSDDPGWIVENVIVDSLLFARALPAGIRTLCDVGSGAGIPGIPLKIVMPALSVTLVEARQRRASFLATAIRELPLAGCRLMNQRVEELSPALAGTFDAVVMRCAGNPRRLISAVERLVSPGGIVVASGPPTATPLTVGEWLQIHGPGGARRFWIHHVT
jgi:16S rRNA (guanine527-N7)-methyltransferase